MRDQELFEPIRYQGPTEMAAEPPNTPLPEKELWYAAVRGKLADLKKYSGHEDPLKAALAKSTFAWVMDPDSTFPIICVELDLPLAQIRRWAKDLHG